LGIGALTAEACEAGDADRWQAAGGRRHCWSAGRGMLLNAVVPMERLNFPLWCGSRPRRTSRTLWRRGGGVAEGNLADRGCGCCVGLAVEGDGNAGIVDAVFFAIADAQEGGVGGIDLPVEAEVTLVALSVKGTLDGVVVGRETGSRQAGGWEAGDFLEVS